MHSGGRECLQAALRKQELVFVGVLVSIRETEKNCYLRLSLLQSLWIIEHKASFYYRDILVPFSLECSQGPKCQRLNSSWVLGTVGKF